ncbi:hypothetical protein N7510_009452 [Penicillium lagena]|uniref:uncharacterized protein n=1 Tax=Penicillium lagena TaxID=94218 RepID=UPI0025408504|nr:uncharacterized protein N7510_009452 [Penicillium lagena]KAJ5606671.1 hypothetical protein N7510_009452 [Penicillium lagena]
MPPNSADNQPGVVFNVPANLEPQYSIAELWDDHLMPLVLNKFSCDDVNGNPKTIFKAVPRVISMTDKGSALYQILDAIGRVNIANMTNGPNANSQQAYAYGNGILDDADTMRSDFFQAPTSA